MTGPVLTLNTGSSSLKASLPTPRGRLRVTVERLGTPDARLLVPGSADRLLPDADGPAALRALLGLLDGYAPAAVAHRIVHGGLRHHGPALVDEDLLAELDGLVRLAPLHMPAGLAVLRSARQALPDVPHTVSFDTALWRSLPEDDQRLPVPDEVHQLGVQRYGFHGLSVHHVRSVVGPAADRLVVAHLGAGCSVSALRAGAPVHTTMSFTPTSGVVSATRSGDLDPHVVLHLLQQPGWDRERVRAALDQHSGLAGPAHGVSDVRDLLAEPGDGGALAMRVFTRSVAMAVAGCAALLDGIDTLVFTGGIGEHAGAVRLQVAERLGHLGVRLEPTRTGGDISAEGATVRTLVVAADEEAVLEQEARELLGRGRNG